MSLLWSQITYQLPSCLLSNILFCYIVFFLLLFWQRPKLCIPIFDNNGLLSYNNGNRTHKHLVRKWTLNHLAITVSWVLICTVYLTACYYHVTYAPQSESTLYSCLTVKEVLTGNRRNIWSLSDSTGLEPTTT